jgi:uncharacterized phage protein gp47/JayE
MPWVTPTLDNLRAQNRDNVQAQLRSGPMIPNSVLRVMADSNAGLAHLTLLYINWLSLQLMPDTAETEWLDRFGDIWRPGGASRKPATFATGVVNVTGLAGVTVPAGSQLRADIGGGATATFQTTAAITMGSSATPASVVSLTAGATGLVVGSILTFSVGIAGIDGGAAIASIVDGVAQEIDDALRVRVLDRIRQPPVGGDAADYVQWVMATPGVNVTRAWCSPLEMGLGTITVRFMTDDMVNNRVGFPSAADIATVTTNLDKVRPVAIKDRWILSPIPEPIDFTISNLSPDTVAVRSAIAKSVAAMLFSRAAPANAINGVARPATTIYRSWVSNAISAVAGIDRFTLTMKDHPMPYGAALAVLGTIVYG